MKFTKTTLATALLASMSVSAVAADVKIYGKANVTVQASDDGTESVTEIKSNASRIGLKGGHALEDDLEVVYLAEFEVQIDDGDKDDETFSQRNIYVGLKGDFGTVLVGKNDTMLKQSQGKVDLFSDLEGDIKNLWEGENRESNTITYISPKFNDFYAGVTYVASEDEDIDDGISAALFYGDKGLKKSDWFASIAVDSEVDDHDTMRATVQTKLGGVVVGAIYHNEENVDGGGEKDGIMVSAKYGIDKWTLKGQLQTASIDGGDDLSGFTAGADYKLGKNTKLFGFYTTFDMDSGEDEDYLAVGMEYKF